MKIRRTLLVNPTQDLSESFNHSGSNAFATDVATSYAEALTRLQQTAYFAVIVSLREEREDFPNFLRSVRMISPQAGRVLNCSPALWNLHLKTTDLVDQVIYDAKLPHTVFQAVLTAAELANTRHQAALQEQKIAKLEDQMLAQDAVTEQLRSLKQQFIMVANHELRTPATIITAALDLMDDVRDKLQPAHRKLLTSALAGANRLNSLIKKFDQFLRLQQVSQVHEKQKVAVSTILNNAQHLVHPDLTGRDVEVFFRQDSDYDLTGNGEQLQDALMHLLSNGIKYTPDGGQIIVRSSIQSGNVEIAVTDTGIGLPTTELENIFEPFYQLGDVLNHHTSQYRFMGGGAGLGLTLSKQIIEAHGGTIRASSNGENKGSTFTITIPVPATLLQRSA